MKRSHSIALTVVAVGLAGAQGQPPAAPAQNCDEARKAAKSAGTAVPKDCAATSHGTAHGGFGATAASHRAGE